MPVTVGALTAACGPNGHGGSGLATDKGAEAGHILAFGGNNQAGPIDVATACNAHGGSGRMDFESETFIAFDPTQITSAENRSNPQPGDPCHTLAKGQQAPAIAFNARQDPDSWTERTGPLDTHNQGTQAVAFSSKDHGADATAELSPTLRAMGHADSHANGGGQMGVAQGMQVRRLTPVECERLQGFPDGYTAVLSRGKPAADGPRYKALGNSWAVPCAAWIGRRVDAELARVRDERAAA